MKLVISETINGVVRVTEKESVIVIADFDTGSSAVPLATVTSKGSIIVGTGNATVGELVVGANGTIPIADSAQVTGLRWGSPSGSFSASDAENRTMAANLTLTNADAYVQFCDPAGASRDINLPAVGVLNHPYWIYNSADADETLTVKNAGGTVIGILTRGKSALFMSSNTTWSAVVDVLRADADGWIPVLDTWTYATATTFTISGDKTGVYSVGDKIKLTQTTEKFFYVVGVSYSSPNTTITICGGTSYTLANATITSPYYSHEVSPVGFPLFFTVNNGSWTTTGTAFTNAPTGTPAFSMQGKIVVLYGEFQCNATSGGTGIFKLTFPAGSIPTPRNTQCGSAYNQNTAVFGNTSIDTSRVWSMAKYDSSALATNSQYFNASISYIVP